MIQSLNIRMYRMGFGDCFLLSFGTDAGPRHILVDCGSITEGQAHVSEVVKDIVATCTPTGGAAPRLELVVATHRHRDHVGGFKDPLWAGVEVGEVWMPWTEDPDDPVAQHILHRQAGFAAALGQALAGKAYDPDAEPLATAVATPQDAMLGMALNALTNEKAMATLHSGFTGRPPRRFLPLKDTVCETRAVGGIKDLRIHVLGPPRDQAAIADMTPPKAEAYLTRRAAAAASGDAKDAQATDGAFRSSWRVDPKDVVRLRGSTFRPDDEKAVKLHAEDPDGELAAAIDNAVNNTSLILMFEVGDQFLLFPGDAQWGTWNAALETPAARTLMAKTTVYKIGHHGSHNATPKSLIEAVIVDLDTALLSMSPVKQWPDIPRAPLIADIQAHGAEVVASQAAAPGLFVDVPVPLP